MFVGQVLAVVGTGTVLDEDTNDATDFPATFFSVRVDQTVKGSLSGVRTVEQWGAMDDSGATALVRGDSLLEIGTTYLFVTNPGMGIQELVAPGFDHVAIGDELERESVIARFVKAYEEEIPFDPNAVDASVKEDMESLQP